MVSHNILNVRDKQNTSITNTHVITKAAKGNLYDISDGNASL